MSLMVSYTARIQNPLTVIAVFSGITEVTGAAVLPAMEPDAQQLFVWFLVLFPFALVLLFFLTLNFNHKVLYAPSDYADEENFMRMFGPASAEERVQKLRQNSIEADEESPDTPEEPPAQDSSAALVARPNGPKLSRAIQQNPYGRYLLAEELVLRALGQELGVEFKREMSVRTEKTHTVLDAVAETTDGQTIIVEVKYISSAAIQTGRTKKLMSSVERIYRTVVPAIGKNAVVIAAVVTDDLVSVKPYEDQIRDTFAKRNLPVDIRLFSMKDLAERYL